LGICVRTQADNTSIATVKVPGVEEARHAISQFHRRKIGYKRINVTLSDDKDQAPAESTR
jgi:meiosis arrest female protein 1